MDGWIEQNLNKRLEEEEEGSPELVTQRISCA
jgi:hypothetical protein